MNALLLKVAVIGLLATWQARSEGHQPPPQVTGVAQEGRLALPGCPEKCGDVTIPYPFGIGKNCSFSAEFELQCNRSSTGKFIPQLSVSSYSSVRSLPLLDISLSPARARTLMRPFSTCNLSLNESTQLQESEVFHLNYPFVFSCTDTVLTVIGCNTLGNREPNRLGCVTLCGPDIGTNDSRCSGVGCCEASLGSESVTSFHPQLWRVSLTSDSSLDSFPLRDCASVFLVEKGRYNFTVNDTKEDISDRAYPVFLDWFFLNIVDDERLKTGGTYSWPRSPNSVCLESRTGIGHTCECSDGYYGNPYLPNGCRDINECQKLDICEGGRICVNYIGSYRCACPDGTIDKGMDYPCMPKDQKYHQLTFGMGLGFGIGFWLLLLLGGCKTIYEMVGKRRLEQYKLHCFKKNYDMLVKKQLVSFPSDNTAERVKFFSIRDLEKATNNFDRSCIVGKGGHGTVYKALLNLEVVAIKMSHVKMEREIEDFINEIILLSQVNHRNIVKLIGCCLENEVPLLVYEFISNGTLFDHLHSQDENMSLPWEDCLRIAAEITSSLAYLHSTSNISIFHRDIKSSNILLDERLRAKLSDFGASKSVELDHTHITTNVQGTWGYLDPEYLQTCQLTEKSDVYSLGVILVELLSKQKPTSRHKYQEEGSLISHFIQSMKENRLLQVVHPSIIKDIYLEEVEIFARVATECLRMKGSDRPTMKRLLVILEVLMIKTENKKKRCTSETQNGNDSLLHGMGAFFNNGDTTTNYDTSNTNWSLDVHTSLRHSSHY